MWEVWVPSGVVGSVLKGPVRQFQVWKLLYLLVKLLLSNFFWNGYLLYLLYSFYLIRIFWANVSHTNFSITEEMGIWLSSSIAELLGWEVSIFSGSPALVALGRTQLCFGVGRVRQSWCDAMFSATSYTFSQFLFLSTPPCSHRHVGSQLLQYNTGQIPFRESL